MTLDEKLRKNQQSLKDLAAEGPVKSKALEKILSNVEGDMTIPKGEYYVDFDIVVEPKATLNIEPGTKFIFGEDGGIVSYGKLIAKGTEDERIVFTSDTVWKDIALAGSKSCGSIIEYCDINKGRGRNQINARNSFRQIEFIREHTGGGVIVFDSEAHITDCNFFENQAIGSGGAIYTENSYLFLKNNDFRYNSSSEGGGVLYMNNSQLRMDGDEIRNNFSTGNIIWLDDTDAEIAGVNMIYNVSGYSIVSFSDDRLHIESSRIAYNILTSTGNPYALSIRKSEFSINDTIVKKNFPNDFYLETAGGKQYYSLESYFEAQTEK